MSEIMMHVVDALLIVICALNTWNIGRLLKQQGK